MPHFSFPYAFLLLPLPVGVYFLLPAYKTSNYFALKVPFYQQMAAYGAQNVSRKKNRFFLLGLIWFCLITALANPQLAGPPQIIPQEGRNLMLALDISGSMRLKDMQQNQQPLSRLELVKQTANAFIKKRIGDRIGLILFGSKAFLQTPLTFDYKTTLHMLDDATVGLAGQTTAIGDAIGLAVKRLKGISKKSKALILLTDGVNNSGSLSPIQAATIAKSNHIKIYTIGLGAERMILQGLFGPQVINPSEDLDESTLKKVSTLTGGVFFRAKDQQDLNKVYQTINQLEPIKTKGRLSRPMISYYHYPLFIACLLLFTLLFKPIIVPTLSSGFTRRAYD